VSEESSTNLSAWFEKRPRWLRIAASQLWSGKALDQAVVQQLDGYCLQEAEGKLAEHVPSFPDDPDGTTSQQGELRLGAIAEPLGINDLAPKKPLSFGNANLVVIYGQNGSGKSGYARILKHLCGARRPRELHPNVFQSGGSSEHETSVRGCKVSFSVATKAETRDWAVGQPAVPELRGVVIFDSDTADVYLNEESEVVYEPRLLSFFTDLVQVCNSVEAAIEARRRALPTALPKIPPKHESTPTGGWYKALTDRTSSQDIGTRCVWTESDTAELEQLRKTLSEPTDEQQTTDAKRRLEHLRALVEAALQWRAAIDDAAVESLRRLREDRETSDAAAKVTAEKSLAAGLLPKVGDAVWRKLWDAARDYSQKAAYPDKAFPNTETGARCVLCQEVLSPEAVARLEGFDGFVRGELARKAQEARTAYEQAAGKLNWSLDEGTIRTKLDAAGANDKALQDTWLDLLRALIARRDAVLAPSSALPRLPSEQDVRSILKDHEATLTTLTSRSATSSDQDRAQMTLKLSELETRQWVSEQRAAVEAEVERLRHIAVLDKAKKSTSTTALSKKKGELADALISKAFRDRFDAELDHLGGKRVRVKLEQTRVKEGKALHQIKINAPTQLRPREVLSDGERRVISLAAFLADATGSPHPTPFVFDDPISSLDQEFEERVVARLIELSKSRQVIVFTHRLSLLVLLQDAAKKESIGNETVCVRRESWGVGEPSDIPLNGKPPIGALKKLRDERLARARKTYTDVGGEEYAWQSKAICSDFRILLERVVEVDLLADVVQRFRRGIQTQNKIQKLAAITDADVAMIERLMTKYSIYEHSQPTEAPVEPLSPDDLNADLTEVINWHAEFSARTSGGSGGKAKKAGVQPATA
jgi:energy-coupling factor transporter ATP-binding protein EcfA2